jgi:hypothetical protein
LRVTSVPHPDTVGAWDTIHECAVARTFDCADIITHNLVHTSSRSRHGIV